MAEDQPVTVPYTRTSQSSTPADIIRDELVQYEMIIFV